jgi:hypothetical protein
VCTHNRDRTGKQEGWRRRKKEKEEADRTQLNRDGRKVQICRLKVTDSDKDVIVVLGREYTTAFMGFYCCLQNRLL